MTILKIFSGNGSCILPLNIILTSFSRKGRVFHGEEASWHPYSFNIYGNDFSSM